jgi:acyl-CoA reductase-like NAD-dependent aldehyde dehydrogenase
MEPSKFLINGEWCTSAKSREIVNPYTGRSVGQVFQASREDIDRAIGAAVNAFARTKAMPLRQTGSNSQS